MPAGRLGRRLLEGGGRRAAAGAPARGLGGALRAPSPAGAAAPGGGASSCGCRRAAAVYFEYSGELPAELSAKELFLAPL